MAQSEYELGHGYNFSAFNVGGFSDVTAAATDSGRKAVSVNALSVFATGHIASVFNPFVEAELTGFDQALLVTVLERLVSVAQAEEFYGPVRDVLKEKLADSGKG